MHGKDENGEYRGPSKSMRKREAASAQDLGTRLIALKESELAALDPVSYTHLTLPTTERV